MVKENVDYSRPESAEKKEYELPERISYLLSLSNRFVQESYPGAYELPSSQVYWLTREEFKEAYEAIPEISTFTHRLLKNIGAETIGKTPYSDDQNIFSRSSTFPPELYIVDEEFPYDNNSFIEKIWVEYYLMRCFAEAAIFHSRRPKYVPYSDEIKDILERRLDIEPRLLSRDFPDIDQEQLNKLIAGYRDILSFDENAKIELDGAAVNFITNLPQELGDSREEILFGAGRDFNWGVVRLLATKAARAALYWLSQAYPENLRKAVKAKYQNFLKDDQEKEEIIKRFMESIGLASHIQIFEAYHESAIPLKFIEAKRKRKKIVYPV